MSGHPDLNRGPPLPQSGALTGLRHVPKITCGQLPTFGAGCRPRPGRRGAPTVAGIIVTGTTEVSASRSPKTHCMSRGRRYWDDDSKPASPSVGLSYLSHRSWPRRCQCGTIEGRRPRISSPERTTRSRVRTRRGKINSRFSIGGRTSSCGESPVIRLRDYPGTQSSVHVRFLRSSFCRFVVPSCPHLAYAHVHPRNS